LSFIDQISHKAEYIHNHLAKAAFNEDTDDFDIILIGHSIGCYVIIELLELLDTQFKSRVKKNILLFPTIERMNETPNGRFAWYATNFFLWFIYFILYLVILLPEKLKKFLIYNFWTRHLTKTPALVNENQRPKHKPSEIVHSMSTRFSCIRSILHMARDEMNQVNQRNSKLIEDNLHLFVFYYGVSDKWCPINYYHEMKSYLNDYSNGAKHSLLLDEHGLEHAFVIHQDQSIIMSKKIHQWIEEAIK
jgi:pimeloyl-ACP methyl ester carboxylesterase